MKNFILSLFLLVFQRFLFAVPGTANGSECYLRLPADCCQWYRYESYGGGPALMDGHVQLDGQRRVVFRVTAEEWERPRPWSRLPVKVLEPAEWPELDARSAQQVGKGELSLYLVLPQAGGDRLLVVADVHFYDQTPRGMRLVSSTMDFQYDHRTEFYAESRQKGPNPQAVVAERAQEEKLLCRQLFHFRCWDEQLEEVSAFSLVPELGLWAFRFRGTEYRLDAIDGEPVAQWLYRTCSPPTLFPYAAETGALLAKGAANGRVLSPDRTDGEVPAASLSAPGDSSARGEASPVYLDSDVRSGYYIVKTGDCLYALSRRFGLSPARLRELNRLRDDRIYCLQKLKVVDDRPEPLPDKRTDEQGCPRRYHVVSHGDYLFKLAGQYHTTVEKLMEINRLVVADLAVDQVLWIE
jgi:LysM repeat protein